MEQMVKRLTEKMIENGIIAEGEREAYLYGLEKLIGKFIGMISVLFFAFLHKTVLPAIVFLVVFCSFRERTGGDHANSPT
ncbi:MAG: accessory gene regulator B family protein [Lachnospiraceae bacterium]